MSDEQNSEMLDQDEQENEEQNTEENENQVSPEEFQKLQEEAENMRNYLKKANEEAKNYRLKAKAYEEAGYSPDEIKEIKQKEEQRKQRELERKGDWDKLKNQLTESFEQKEKEYQSKLEDMRKTMERTLIQKEVVSAISKHEGIDTLLKPHVESNVKLFNNEDGTMTPRVVDDDGSPKFNDKGDYMTVEEYVASLKEHEDFGVAFRARNQSGSGTRSAPTNGKSPVSKKARSEMTDNERRDFIGKHGWDAYYELPV